MNYQPYNPSNLRIGSIALIDEDTGFIVANEGARVGEAEPGISFFSFEWLGIRVSNRIPAKMTSEHFDDIKHYRTFEINRIQVLKMLDNNSSSPPDRFSATFRDTEQFLQSLVAGWQQCCHDWQEVEIKLV